MDGPKEVKAAEPHQRAPEHGRRVAWGPLKGWIWPKYAAERASAAANRRRGLFSAVDGNNGQHPWMKAMPETVDSPAPSDGSDGACDGGSLSEGCPDRWGVLLGADQYSDDARRQAIEWEKELTDILQGM